jgi:hypothetical protein
MNQVLISILSFVFIASAYLSWIVLPLVNLNVITHSEADFYERAQAILDKQRSNPEPISQELMKIQVPNIEILAIEKLDLADYYIFRIDYRFNHVFFNKFIDKSDLQQLQKNKFFILDRS